jgi:hypothetical protein
LNAALENVLKCLALLSSGLFAGAGFYLSTVEHPARMSPGASVAPREFGPSCKRAPLHQAVLAIVCFVCGVSLALMATNPLLPDEAKHLDAHALESRLAKWARAARGARGPKPA